MMTKARNAIQVTMRDVDPDADRNVWQFLNEVYMATAEDSLLAGSQQNLLESLLSRVKCRIYTFRDEMERTRFALEIATWINSVQCANTR